MKLTAPVIATLLFLAVLLPSIGSFGVFLLIVTDAIMPLALLVSGIRRRAPAVEFTGWIWFALNSLFFLWIISG